MNLKCSIKEISLPHLHSVRRKKGRRGAPPSVITGLIRDQADKASLDDGQSDFQIATRHQQCHAGSLEV